MMNAFFFDDACFLFLQQRFWVQKPSLGRKNLSYLNAYQWNILTFIFLLRNICDMLELF